MHCFQDNAGRTWTVAINVTAVKRVRALVGVDLLHLVEEGLSGLASLLGDPVRLVDVLYALCREEAEARGVSDEDFGGGLAGDALAGAGEAFVEELIAFFPDARVRTGLHKVVAAARRLQEQLLEQVQDRIDTFDPQAAARAWNASFGNSPASSDSTPGPSPSPNS